MSASIINNPKINFLYQNEIEEDLSHISNNKNEVIAGFLAIGEKDGWKVLNEGGTHEMGLRFTRYMFRKFCSENATRLGEYKEILDSANRAFYSKATLAEDDEGGIHSRVIVDATISGWKKHCVTRIISLVGTKPNKNGPFAEVLINSARSSRQNPYCYPFHVSILPNGAKAEARWKQLKNVSKINAEIANEAFYHSENYQTIDLFKKDFRVAHAKDPGENSLRLLNGLEFLSSMRMKAQTIGNCWMKQTKREVLLLLFIQTLTHRSELEIKEAWNLSKSLYRKWKTYVRQEIGDMIQKPGMIMDLAHLVKAKLQQPH